MDAVPTRALSWRSSLSITKIKKRILFLSFRAMNNKIWSQWTSKMPSQPPNLRHQQQSRRLFNMLRLQATQTKTYLHRMVNMTVPRNHSTSTNSWKMQNKRESKIKTISVAVKSLNTPYQMINRNWINLTETFLRKAKKMKMARRVLKINQPMVVEIAGHLSPCHTRCKL